jgi:NADH:ubiquinone oxidoreductase subunit K
MFWIFSAYILMLFVMGLYCLLVTQNIVRALIGIEILMKAVTLLIIIAGQTIGNAALSQAMIITLIVIETVFIAVAMGIVLCVYKHSGSLDTNNLTDLKGQ